MPASLTEEEARYAEAKYASWADWTRELARQYGGDVFWTEHQTDEYTPYQAEYESGLLTQAELYRLYWNLQL